MPRRLISAGFIAAGVIAATLPLAQNFARAEGPQSDTVLSSTEQSELYATKIKPLLRERCFGCHGALKQEAGLRLDTVASMRTGGDSGQAIAPALDPEEGGPAENNAEESLLFARIASQDPDTRMPPPHEGEAFTTEQIQLLNNWLRAGAPGIENETPEKDPEDHWSFRPLTNPGLPSNLSAEQLQWSRNGIDQWIATGHTTAGVRPVSEASRAILLRRLSLDLIGILPTAQEIADFEQDTAPDWYEKAVERLLDDPRHGERWARHWMDNWRYSDWWGLGNELRNSQRTIWHWRDWIIQSLNSDKPYDQMVRSMLAADELTPDDESEIRATGFLARNYYIFNRHKWLDETVEHVGKAFLGLTMNCAKCHDHKFDPISHVDYYKMRAFFEPHHIRVDMVPGKLDIPNSGIPRAFDAELTTPTYLFIRGEEARPDTTTPIPPGVPELLAKTPLEIRELELPPTAYELQRRDWVTEAYRNETLSGVTKLEGELKEAERVRGTTLTALEEAKSSKPEEQTVRAGTSRFTDEFKSLNQDHWEIFSGNWKIADDGLEQNQDGAVRSHLRYLGTVPTDFEATLTYRLRGGSQWRSIGIAFDTTDASEQTVYASGVAGSPKVQASYKQNGQSYFPGEGAKGINIPTDRDVTLKVLVRDNLINVYLDGERVVAWRSPVARTAGDFLVYNFDAISTFKRFDIQALPLETELFDPTTKELSSGNRIAEAERAFLRAQRAADVAARKLELQQATLTSVDARIAAFTAQWNSEAAESIQSKHRDAVKAERYVKLLNGRLGVLLATPVRTAPAQDSATQEVSLTEEEKKKLDEAKGQEQAALASYESDVLPSDTITPFVATKWSVTRFKFTGSDDPAIAIPSKSSGRRSALANWIASPENPLTARVAVNHLWTRHMDQPLAANTFDFGRNSPDPVNPELVDWLANELIDSGWSMKHIHRLIVNSATYRMSSSVQEAKEQLALDPDNKRWWRRTPIRLESQVIRDSILSLAGRLDPTVGGPPVAPDQQDKSLRRSLYFFHSNNDRNQFLTTFDEATVSECYQREQSIVPQQALALSNSSLVLDNIGPIAESIASQTPTEEKDFIRRAFQIVLGLKATEQEIQFAEQAIQTWLAQPDISGSQARALLVLSLLNHNDFVTLR